MYTLSLGRMKKSYPANKYGLIHLAIWLIHLIMQGFSDFRIDAEILWYENVNMYFFIVQKMFRLEY